MGTFGDKFRKERERRGFSFDDVSNVTKIASRMLRAIEEERFEQLPGGVFNKGFIRAYARHLGLNDEEAVNEYLSALREAQVEAQNTSTPVPPPARRASDRRPAKPSQVPLSRPAEAQLGAPPKAEATAQITQTAHEELPDLQLPKAEHIRPRPPAGARGTIPWTVPALIVLMVLVGILLWNRHSRSARAAAENAAHASASSSVSPAPTTPGSEGSGPHPVETTSKVTGASAPAASRSASSLPAEQPAPASAVPPLSPASSSEATPAVENDVTTRNLKPGRSAATTPEPAPALKLVIRAAENSWISVIADGQQLTQETLIAPAHASARASREIVVKVGNAAGVSFLLNDKAFSPQGSEAEVKTFVFDSTGMRTLASGQGPAPGADTSNR